MPRKPKPVLHVARGRSLTAGVVDDLGSAIVTGKFSKRNAFPVEADLCRRYRVSRGVVREAVKMLTAKGLLASRTRQGTWVLPEEAWNLFDPDVMRWMLDRNTSIPVLLEFGEARMAVECAAAALAAVRATFQQKAAIERALARMVAAEYGEDDPLKADVAFHVAVLRAAGNRYLLQFRELIETALRIDSRTAGRSANVGDHRKIFDAIIAGDADAAYRTTRSLVAQSMEHTARSAGASRPGSRTSIRKLIGL